MAMEAKSIYTYFRISKTDDIHSSARRYRDLRLRALKASPGSFASTYDVEAALTEAEWRDQLTLPGREVFICATTSHDHHPSEWVGQVTLRGPISQEDFFLPPQSGHPPPGPDSEEERSQVLGLFTLPEHRGNGLGAHLCRQALEYLRQNQSSPKRLQVRLMVKPENHATVKLYQRLGFVVTGMCTLAEALIANGDGHLLPKDISGAKYSDRTGLIMASYIDPL